jgi:hypothetical protein
MSFETLSLQQLKALLAIRKDFVKELAEDLNYTLDEIAILEDLINVKSKTDS